jgi:SAM-dependent methyltransferase
MLKNDETTLFRTSWSLYDALAEKNYMFHRQIYAVIAQLMQRRQHSGDYSLLDLGCGNARFLAPCLITAPPTHYHGVDLSQAALDEACTHLKTLPNVTLRCEDMLAAAITPGGSFNTVFSSYAVHHLDAEGKQQLFHACARLLPIGGQFILVDIARELQQSRQEYLEGYLHTMRTRWRAVQADDLDAACAHVAAFDYPETVPALLQMASEAGFADAMLLDRHEQHHVLLFTR